ncbi:MAG: FAD-binding oxidoreductase [Pyrinomonadaceae bacterium]
MIKDVRSESPFWLMKSGYVVPHSSLTDNLKTDFLVIGGGISGALVTQSLASAGAGVVMIDRRHFAMGSTAASTALLQYDVDVPLHELIEKMGEKRAVRAYELSLQALVDLIEKANNLPESVSFDTRLSIRFAEKKKDFKFLEKEYQARSVNNFDMELWDESEVARHFPVSRPGALLTRPSAVADPYLLTHAVLHEALENGARAFDKTFARKIDRHKSGVTVDTGDHKISAKKLIIACGYESVNYIRKRVGTLKSTYAIASEPLGTERVWYENASFWTTGDPYSYGRTTADNRIIFGGYDEEFTDPGRRDSLVEAKSKTLAKAFAKMFPDIPLRIDYSWGGTFIETDDGLPYIGPYNALPHTYFALGFGGNGITFSQLAADILTDMLLGRKNKDADLFSFERESA